VCCDGLLEGEESDFLQTILLASASRTEGVRVSESSTHKAAKLRHRARSVTMLWRSWLN
jgi:hypothetical protein